MTTIIKLSQNEIVQQCYQAFEHVPRPRKIEISPVKNPADYAALTSSIPLRELTDSHLRIFAQTAMLTAGSAEDYKYFLPRILELVSFSEGGLAVDLPVIALRLIDAQWRSWSDVQVEAISTTLLYNCYAAINSHPFFTRGLEDWLCCLAILELNVLEFLDYWSLQTTPHAALQMALLNLDFRETFPKNNVITGPFWDYASLEIREIITKFMRSNAAKHILIEGYDDVMEEQKYLIEEAFDLM